MSRCGGILQRGVPDIVSARTTTLLRAYARRAGGELERALLAVWSGAPGIPAEAWRRALVTGSMTPLEPFLAEFAGAHRAVTLRRLRQAFERGGVLAAADLQRALGLSGLFALPHEAAAAWAEAHGGKLVVGITAQQRQVFRELLAKAQMGLYTVDELARKTKDLWGFTSQQVAALAKVQQRLEARKASGLLTEARAAKAYQRAVNASRRYRAYVISRHQTVWSLNAGQEAMWKAAGGAGLFNVPSARRVWIITPDELLCDFCQKMAGQQVKLGQPFINPLDGRAIMVPQESHPLCRCTEGLVLGEAAGRGGVKPPKPKKPGGPMLLPPTPKPVLPPPSPPPPVEEPADLMRQPTQWKRQKTWEELRQAAQKQFGVNLVKEPGIKAAEFKKLMDDMNAVCEELERMSRAVPRAHEVRAIARVHMPNGVGGLWAEIPRSISLSPELVSVPTGAPLLTSKILKKELWVVGRCTLRAAMRHEYGHAIHSELKAAASIEGQQMFLEWWNLYQRHDRSWWAGWVSKYGSTNAQEAFAESWAAFSSESYIQGTLPAEVEGFMTKVTKTHWRKGKKP